MENEPNFISPDSNKNSIPEVALPKFVSLPSRVVHWLVVVLAIIAVVAFFMNAYFYALWPFGNLLPVIPNPTACTMEAKLCSDGTAVGRTGPNCEFAPCPGEAGASAKTVYPNNLFGFSIILSESWKGYTVNQIKDDIYDVSGKTTDNNGVVDSFQIIELHHPLETAENPREVMPIMIFTPVQWMHIQNGEWSVGAAPIPPSLLGQNSRWIMALPARYNFDYKTGWEEVDQLVHTLKAFEINPEGQHCGGFIQNAPTCTTGYTCKLNINNPDTGGVCVRD